MGNSRIVMAIFMAFGLLLAISPSVQAAPSPPPAKAAQKAWSAPVQPQNNCEEVKEQLKRQAARGDMRGAMCHETKPVPKRAQAAAQAAHQKLADIIDFPQWCQENAVGGQWKFEHRRLGCRYMTSESRVMLDWWTGKPVEVGRVWYTQADLVLASTFDSTTYQHQQHIVPFLLEREAEAGLMVSGGFSCQGWCLYGAQDYPQQPLVVGQAAKGIRYFDTTVEDPGEVGHIQTKLDTVVSKIGYTDSVGSTFSPDIRCDHATPAVNHVGCILPGYIPTMEYSLTGIYPQLAAHIKKAQDSGAPGDPDGISLNRQTDQTMRDKNGNTACPGRWTRPANHDCDEYPFRSSVQGAYTAWSYTPDDPATPPRRPWPGRTYAGCQISDPAIAVFTPGISTASPDGYSVCMIDSWQNQQGGNDLDVDVYRQERVINKDPFYVEITP